LVTEALGAAPKRQFEIIEPDKFVRITMVSLQIHQKFEADYSDHAEFVVTARHLNDFEAQMKPNTTYDLGAPGPNFKVMITKVRKCPASSSIRA